MNLFDQTDQFNIFDWMDLFDRITDLFDSFNLSHQTHLFNLSCQICLSDQKDQLTVSIEQHVDIIMWKLVETMYIIHGAKWHIFS